MIKIYYTSFKNKLDDATFFRYLNLLPLDIKEKILRFRRLENAQASLYGKLLLKYGLEELGLDFSLANLKYTKYGRPYISDKEDFNISHSGDYVVCAISTESKIGIDIEKIRPININRFKNQFIKKEWDSIISSENVQSQFYHYWTIKESVSKANGKGLNIPFNNIYVNVNDVVIGDTKWYTRRINFFNNYILHIASDIGLNRDVYLLDKSF